MVGIQTFALCIDKMFATSSCVTIQGEVVRLITISQRFSSLLFFRGRGRAKKDKWRFLLDVLEQSGTKQH